MKSNILEYTLFCYGKVDNIHKFELIKMITNFKIKIYIKYKPPETGSDFSFLNCNKFQSFVIVCLLHMRLERVNLTNFDVFGL
jgi:hypothetical protein